MQKYIDYLLQDIEKRIVEQWQKNPPHFYKAGFPDPYLVPPKGYDQPVGSQEKIQESNHFVESIREAENWLEGNASHSMFHHFDMSPQLFPPPERLSLAQTDDLVESLLRLWAAFNYSVSLPQKAPSNVIYPMLLKRMLENTILFENGHFGIEFCDYEPKNCPFGIEYCSCKES